MTGCFFAVKIVTRGNEVGQTYPPGLEQLKRRHFLKSTGIVRKVDELGRIVLPIELRRTLDIEEKDSLEIYMDGPSIVLRKFQPACIFCDEEKDIIEFRGKNVCPKCFQEMSAAFQK